MNIAKPTVTIEAIEVCLDGDELARNIPSDLMPHVLSTAQTDDVIDTVIERGLAPHVLARSDTDDLLSEIRERDINLGDLTRDYDSAELFRELQDREFAVIAMRGPEAEELLDLLAGGHAAAAYDLLQSCNSGIELRQNRERRVSAYGKPAHLL